MSEQSTIMIGYGKEINILKFPPFYHLNEENPKRMLQLAAKKIFFPVLYPIVYNPDVCENQSIYS